MIRVGINGFGRIGRNFFRAVLASGAEGKTEGQRHADGAGQQPEKRGYLRASDGGGIVSCEV